MEGDQYGHLDHVDPERFVGEAKLLEFALHLPRDVAGEVRIRGEGAAKSRDAGTGTAFESRSLRALVGGVRIGIRFGGGDIEPRVVEGVVLGR